MSTSTTDRHPTAPADASAEELSGFLRLRGLLRPLASLWMGAVLLVLLLFGMGSATIFEKVHGTAATHEAFYGSWWFTTLLALLSLNVLAALLVRLPWTRRDLGFLLTHVGIVVVLIGGWVTRTAAVRGQVEIPEGATATEFQVENTAVFSIDRPEDGGRSVVDLRPLFEAVDEEGRLQPPAGLLLDDLEVKVLRLHADTEWRRKVTNDNTEVLRAVEVRLIRGEEKQTEWVREGPPTPMVETSVALRMIVSPEELASFVPGGAADGEDDGRRLQISIGGGEYQVPVATAMRAAVPVGTTGFRVKVLRYLPHASVQDDNSIINVSGKPLNPFVEVQVEKGTDTWLVKSFAKVPEFAAMHGEGVPDGFALKLVTGPFEPPQAPVEVLWGPGDEVRVRFDPEGEEMRVVTVNPGVPLETPWPGLRLEVLRCFDHARATWVLEPLASRRPDPVPGAVFWYRTPDKTGEVGIQKGQRREFMISGKRYLVTFANESRPLGFRIKLEKFRIGRYPGSMRPRTFESHVTILDPGSGLSESHVVSMNKPVDAGAFTLYQSSYRSEGERAVTVLSVGRDPGLPIVYGGYFLLMFGMIWVLVSRARAQRAPCLQESGAAAEGGTGT